MLKCSWKSLRVPTRIQWTIEHSKQEKIHLDEVKNLQIRYENLNINSKDQMGGDEYIIQLTSFPFIIINLKIKNSIKTHPGFLRTLKVPCQKIKRQREAFNPRFSQVLPI
ncbi:hypothetical protein H5410_001013 [Solanum commersonii]|uniref:Uncharacterized protein n=1 Tax=Solanum commersonii TaxID=4109 RepID=A0A9J6AXU0_SOLCO|nr:hypothetical protein H5410_001013 [Solanum commersonii]